MQAIFILGLFGMVYATMMVFTISSSQSAMQEKLDEIASVKEMFQDVDFAINKNTVIEVGHANDEPCLAAGGDLTFVQEYVSWGVSDLELDPWNSAYRCYTFLPPGGRIVLYADGGAPLMGPNSVEAPVRAFALVSAGPDRQFDTVAPANYNDTLTLEAPADSDDIVYTFSTYDSMLSLWDEAYNKVDKISGILLENYQQQFRGFEASVLAYYQSLDFAVFSTMTQEERENSWKIDPGLLGDPDYPRLEEGLDYSGELGTMPVMLMADVVVDVADADSSTAVVSVVEFPLGPLRTWDITYNREIKASGD